MGFDLYGVNPMSVGTPPVRPTSDFNYESEEWKNYFAEQEFYERLNPGVYFRSNVWYWRPVVDFIQSLGADEAMIRKLSYNDGAIISEEEFKDFIVLFYNMVEDGSLDHYIQARQAEIDSLPDEECPTCDGSGIRFSEMCHSCNGKGMRENFMKNYPIDKDILLEFFEFAKLSGGFQIN